MKNMSNLNANRGNFTLISKDFNSERELKKVGKASGNKRTEKYNLFFKNYMVQKMGLAKI